jgi:hypothetical protein
MRRWWYNNFTRHFWYHYFNLRYPNLPRVKPGRISRTARDWAYATKDEIDSSKTLIR